MKSKIMTRAMAVFLAFILSFTMIVPSTFATGDEDADTEGVSTEILYEPIEDEETEDETEPPEPTDVVEADEDDFEVDIVLEDYIRDNADETYVGEVSKMKVYNALTVKNTMFDGSLVKKTDTIDSIMYSIEDSEDEASMSKFIAQLDATVALYDVNENSEYLVGMANTMMDSQTYVQDYCVAEYNANGNVVDGCHYDYDTGLVYIPKDLYYNEDGTEYTVGSIQIQLMQVLTADTGDMTSDVESSTFDDDSVNVYSITEEIFALETTVQADAGLDEDDIVVTVNGLPVTEDDYDYDPATGELVIDDSSASIQTVSVASREGAGYDIQTYGSVSSYDDMDDYNAQNKITVPSWMTTGTAFYGYAPVAYAETGFDPGTFTPGESYVYTSDYYNDCQGLYDLITRNVNSGSLVASDLEIAPTQYVCVALDNNYRLCRTGSGTDEQWYLGNDLAYYNSIGGVANVSNGTVADGTIATGISYLGTIYLECCHISRDASGQDWFTNMSGDNYNVSNPNDSAQEQVFMWKPVMVRCLAMGRDNSGDYAVFGVYTGAIALQNGTAVFKVHTTSADGRIAVQKTSNNAALTAENDCYSLEGAVYGVFTDYTTAQNADSSNYPNTAYNTITTKADGSSDFITLPGGTYYVKEVVASAGHELDTTIYTVDVNGEAGLRDLHQGTDGNWYLYLDGNIDTDYTGVFSNQYGTWYVKNGQVDFSYNATFNGGNVPYNPSADPGESGWAIENGQVVDSYWCTLSESQEFGTGANQNGLCIIDDNAYSGALIVGNSRMTQLYEAGQYGGSWEYVHGASFVTCWGGNYSGNDSGSINSPYNVSKMKQFVQESLDYVGYCNVFLELTVNQRTTAMVDAVMNLANELSSLSSTFYGNTVYPTVYIMTAVGNESGTLDAECNACNDYLYANYDNDLILDLRNDIIGGSSHQDTFSSDGLHFSDTSLMAIWADIQGHLTSTTVIGSSEETIDSVEPFEYDPMGLEIVKISEDEELTIPAPLSGAQFTIKYYDSTGYGSVSDLDGVEPTRTWVIETKDVGGRYVADLDDDYLVKSMSDELYKLGDNAYLPLGTITVEETKAPEGYLTDGSYLITSNKQHVADSDGIILLNVKEDLQVEGGASLNSGNHSYTKYDKVIRGGVAIYKYDPETYTLMDGPQGDADLKDATFAIKNLNPYQVKVDGNICDSGTVVKQIKTEEIVNDDGSINYVAYTDDDTLPYGDYEIYECDPSTGYMIPDTNYDFEFSIVENHKYVSTDFTGRKLAVGNIVIRGGFEIVKRDLESGRDVAEGGASLKNAELTLINRSENAVLVKGELYEPGEVIMVLYTNDDGYASVDNDTLPYGTYEIVETQAPEGYLPHDQYKENDKDDGEPVGVLTRNFVIRTDGEMVDLTDYTYDFDINDYVYCAEGGDAIYNQVIRADFAIRKIDSDTQKKMTGVIFKIESETTHEYHYFMTDENGAYSSAVDYAEHTHNTNYHDDENTWDETDIKQLENHCGMWFYGYDDPDSTQIDNSLGALPYDTYTITEIKTEANKNHVMWEDTFTVGPNDNNIVIDLNDIENTTWDIDTVATFESTNTKYAPVSENTITIDAVSYENLTIGQEYTLVAKLYDKNTQNFVKNAYGEDVMSITAFTPRLHFGTANTEIVFDSTGLDGHDIVVFEYVYDGDDLMKDPVLYETDPEAADQTLHFPEIQTTALDAETGTHTSFAGETITIVDTVEYSNLQPGREYTVTGTLMNQKTGEPVLTADGEEITSEATFTPDEPDGYVTVVFDFDGTGLEGVVTVVFEHVYYKGIEYAAHADINDEGQTVYIPKIHTTAWAEETGINAASAGEDITLYDTVSYKGVEPDQEYHIFSVLFNADTHEAEVDSDGNEIWSDYGPFTAEESEGQVDVEFNIDASRMEGHRTVFYEILYRVDTDEETGETTYTLIAEEDLADVPDETIYFPDIHTNAWDSETGENIMEAKENVTLIDTVTYTNLAPGHEYTVTGVLMDKETGEPILDAEGNEVTSEAVFTPEESDGTVEVEFIFDATGLEGTTIVVFEDLYYEDIQLTTHADLEDEDQTVYVPEIHTTAIAESTGTHEVTAEGSVTIVDTVEYTNLLPGKTYTMSGELMDASSGDSLGITANTVFTPDEPDGTVDVTFTFDADGMDDKTVVVFEECSIATEDENVPVAEHKDLTDTDQQVKLTAPPATDTPTGTPTSTDSPKTGQIAGFSALGAALAAAGAAVAGTVARKKRTGAGA